jgi:hypothetical protein
MQYLYCNGYDILCMSCFVYNFTAVDMAIFGNANTYNVRIRQTFQLVLIEGDQQLKAVLYLNLC